MKIKATTNCILTVSFWLLGKGACKVQVCAKRCEKAHFILTKHSRHDLTVMPHPVASDSSIVLYLHRYHCFKTFRAYYVLNPIQNNVFVELVCLGLQVRLIWVKMLSRDQYALETCYD